MPIERILEPEVMDTEQDAVEYDSMDFSEVNLDFALRALELAPAKGRVLDMGTGTARIPILMLQHGGAGLHIHGVDLSVEMLKIARTNVDTAGLADRITLQQVDAKGLPYGPEDFQMVISNSLAHHIPDPLLFFREVARVAGEEGVMFLRDLVRPGSVTELEGLVSKHAGDADAYQQKLFRDSLCAALTIKEVEEYLKRAGIRDARTFQSSDRHWTVERRAHTVQPA